MNKISKLLSVFVIAGTVSAGVIGAAGCHTHTYSEEWSSDSSQHWHAATCAHTDKKSEAGNHTDENDDGKCDVCGYQMETVHEHTYADGWTSDETGHWHAATCAHTGEKSGFAAHTDGNDDGKCDVCGYQMEPIHEHTYADGWTSDETGHWHAATCEHTGEKGSFAAHVDENDDGMCDVCGYEEGVIRISTVEDFLEFRTSDALSGTYKLYNDIDLSGIEIDEDAKAVIGSGVVFDGNGYTIKNATYAAGTSKVGLFCKSINGGTVRNIKFLNCAVTSGSESPGLLAGTCEGTSVISGIEFNSCSVTTTSNYGGLVFARNESAAANITISEITTKNGCFVSCAQYGGLIVGDMTGTTSVSFKNLDVDGELKGSSGNGALIAGRTRAGATVSVENAVISGAVNNPTNNAIISGNGACAKLTVSDVLIVESNSALVAKTAPTLSEYDNLVAVEGVTVTGATGTGTDTAAYLKDTLGFDFENVWMTEGNSYRLRAASTNIKSDGATITKLDVNTGNAVIRFSKGEAFSSSGIVVMGTYSDGVMLVLEEGTDYTVDSTAYNKDAKGTYTITVKSAEDQTKTDTYSVNVVEETGFNVYDEFMIRTYRVGDKLDTENLVVKAVWSDGIEEELAKGAYSLSDTYNLNAVGAYTISVTYGSYEAVQIDISVVASVPVPVDGKIYVKVDMTSNVANGTKTDGVETFNTLTDAIDFLEGCDLEDNVTKVIYIAKGTYEEKVTTSLDNLVLVGEGTDKTVLTYSAVESTVDILSGEAYGLDCATLHVNGTGFMAYNLSIRNDFDYINDSAKESSPQGLALTINGDGAVIANCYLYGNQDTLYLKSGRAYFYRTQIDGNIDFIFGNETGLAYFEECTIKAITKSSKQEKNNGYVTAMRAETSNKPDYGYIFDSCTLTDDGKLAEGSMSLGRPWGPAATVAYINCSFSKAYSVAAYDGSAKSRWYDMSGNLPQNADFVEYGSTGEGAITEAVTGGKILTAEQAAEYTKANIFAATNGKCTWSAAWDCDAAHAALAGLVLVTDQVTGIYVSSESVSVEKDGTAQLLISVTPWNAADKNVVITVEDETIATYADGVVSGLKAGSTVITATYGNFVESVTVNVTEPVVEPVTGTTYTYAYGEDNGVEWVDNTTTTTNSSDGLKASKIEATNNITLMASGNKVTVTMTGFTSGSSNAQPYVKIELVAADGTVVGTLIGTTPAGKVQGDITFPDGGVVEATAEFSSVRISCAVSGKSFGMTSAAFVVE